MQIINCIQGTDEWKAARAAHVTASRISDVMAKPRSKGGESLTRRNYLYQIVAEILSGKSCEADFSSKFTERGTENELYARATYEVTCDVEVEQVGFVEHPTIARYGCSPDGLVGKDGMIEIKCPKPSTHIEYLRGKVPPEEYHYQMLSGMDTCERSWCDFISYCPTFKEPLNLFVVRFDRDDRRIAEIRDGVEQFNRDVDAMLQELSLETSKHDEN